jgi:site-specific recombinase XerC
MAVIVAWDLCNACYQRDPARVATWLAGTIDRLQGVTPVWFEALANHIAARSGPAVTIEHLRRVGAVIASGTVAPAAVIEALNTQGRSPGGTTRLVDAFFAAAGLGAHLDEPQRQADGRRQRRLDRFPDRLRPAAQRWMVHLDASRDRARLHGVAGLGDRTIEARLASLAVLATQLHQSGIDDWAAASTTDIEAFITTNTSARLAAARSFFAFARCRRLTLINPAAGLDRRQAKGFAGRTLDPAAQRQLLRRWADPSVGPIERTVGLLCLLHAASSAELRAVTIDHVDLKAGKVRLGRRPRPLPLDPLTLDALTACLMARAAMGTANPHAIVTRGTRLHAGPASAYFMNHVLDRAGTKPAPLRQTRVADLAHRTDPRLVATALGMTEEGAMHYLTDAVDHEDIAFSTDLIT